MYSGLRSAGTLHTEETANAHRSRNGRDVSVTESQTSTSRPPERSHAHKRTMLGAGRRAQSGSTHRSSAASTSLSSFAGGFSQANGYVSRIVCARVVSATPPSIAIEALVLGGPEVVRVVLNSSSRQAGLATEPCSPARTDSQQ